MRRAGRRSLGVRRRPASPCADTPRGILNGILRSYGRFKIESVKRSQCVWWSAAMTSAASRAAAPVGTPRPSGRLGVSRRPPAPRAADVFLFYNIIELRCVKAQASSRLGTSTDSDHLSLIAVCITSRIISVGCNGGGSGGRWRAVREWVDSAPAANQAGVNGSAAQVPAAQAEFLCRAARSGPPPAAGRCTPHPTPCHRARNRTARQITREARM
ncbi:hypothetical protein EVAR_92126_1 [Eumeta japonica]|uniref:Uncharacterized protein n=1 Tax=Eumeta variegata TaxID=151549 RepID=A0A4C1SZ53_EUMVA|nr:hypothetical protein EVAR_92126_1 [Eumeta japonica]